MTTGGDSVALDLLVTKLASSPVLSHCRREDLAGLLPFLRERRLAPGEALCHAGQPARDMWLVLKGTLRLTRADASPRDIHEGLLGEEAALGIEHYLADIVALDHATVAALDKDATPLALRGGSTRARAFCRALIQTFAPTPVTLPRPDAVSDRITAAIAIRKLVGWILAVVVPLVLLPRLASHGLDWEQRQMAAALAATAMLWIFGSVAPYVAGLLVVLVCTTLGVVPNDVILSGFASNGFFLALSMFCLGAVVIESGAIDRGFLLLMRACPPGTVWRHAAALTAGVILTPVIALVRDRARVLAPLAVETAQTFGHPAASRERTHFLLVTFFGLSLFTPMFLTGSALSLALFASLPEQVQDAMPQTRWLVASFAAAFVLVASFVVAYFVLLPRGTEASADVPAARRTIDAQLAMLGPMRVTEALAVGGMVLFLGLVATVSTHRIDHRLLALSIVCGYLLLGTLGKQQLNFHVDWSMLLLLGTLIGIVAAIIHVDLHTALAGSLPWLDDLAIGHPRQAIALLALLVVVAGFFIPVPGAMIGIVAIPLAMIHGVDPWVVTFVILLMSEVWFWPYQSASYRAFREVVEANAGFDESVFLRFNAVMAVARVAALAASILYWERLRIL